MPNNKLSKYLHKPYTERKGNKTHTPVVLTDGKGKWLESKISQPTEKESYGGPKAARRVGKAASGLNTTSCPKL